MRKIDCVKVITAGDPELFNDEIDYEIEAMQQAGFDVVDIKLTANEGQWCAVILISEPEITKVIKENSVKIKLQQ